jgi:hypothetical protein
MIPHVGLSVGGMYTIPVFISRGMMGIIQPLQSLSYVDLLDPINSACGQYIIKCSFKGPLRTVLNRHKRGLPLWSLAYPRPSARPFHLMILCVSLVASSGLKFKHQSILYQILTILIPLEVRRGLHASETNHSYSNVSYN